MIIASDLLQRQIQTLVDDNTQWQTLIADDVLWELAYAPSIGHPAQLVWAGGTNGGSVHKASLVLAGGGGELPVLRTQGVSLGRSGTCSRRSQGGGAHQGYGTDVSPGLMCYFCVLQAARSRSYENISILCARLGHLTRRSLVSNLEDNLQAKLSATVYKAVVHGFGPSRGHQDVSAA